MSYVCGIETGSKFVDQRISYYKQENQIAVIVLLMYLWAAYSAFINIEVKKNQAKCYTLDL